MSLPATPERRRHGPPLIDKDNSPPQLHSILRQPNRDINTLKVSPTVHNSVHRKSKSVSPQSQVRFSIPDPGQISGLQVPDEMLSEVSPSKIVFPRDSGDNDNDFNINGDDDNREMGDENYLGTINSRGHFLDMHSRVMLDVPEEIWKFHTTRKEKKQNGHRKTKSLQAPFDQQHKSPLHSRTNSLQAIILDTVSSLSREKNGYQSDLSGLNGNPSKGSRQGSPLKLPPQTRPEIYLSPESPLNSYKIPVPLEISLPPYLSPVNKEKTRRSVIFDGEGYSQVREDISTDSEEPCTEGSIPSAEHDVSFSINHSDDTNIDKALGIDEHANVNLKLQKENLRKKQSIIQKSNSCKESLEILATPSQFIEIPDLEKETQKQSSNGTLKFFDAFEPSQQPLESLETCQEQLSPGKERDKLDLNFTFPSLGDQSDFQKVDSSSTTQEFRDRRSKLMEQNSSPHGIKGHRHRRSRSIHNANDMFAATSTPPQIPNRSPLRPKSPTIENENANHSEMQIKEPHQTASNKSYDSDQASSDYEDIEEDNGPKLPHETTTNQSKSDVANKTDDSIKVVLERKVGYGGDYSVAQKALQEPTIHLPKQISYMNSFSQPVTPPGDEDLPILENSYLHLNLLSPRRSLSNVGSQSSYNSQFSRRTHTSNGTSLPSNYNLRQPLPIDIMTKNHSRGLENDSSKNVSKSLDVGFQSSPKEGTKDNIRSIYEKHEGRTVEVIVLDDDECENDKYVPNLKKKLPHHVRDRAMASTTYDEASKNYARIIQMCEETAIQAKNIILQLVEDNSNSKFLNRPLPPADSCTLAQGASGMNLQRLQNGNGKLKTNRERYVKNLDRAMKARSMAKPKFAITTRSDML